MEATDCVTDLPAAVVVTWMVAGQEEEAAALVAQGEEILHRHQITIIHLRKLTLV